MQNYGTRWGITVWLTVVTLSLIMWGSGGTIHATGNQYRPFVIAQGMEKTSLVRLTKKDLRRISDEGPVEITLLYLNPLGQEASHELSFEVRMNTHSVSLDAFEMEKISSLRVDGGTEQKALGWFNPGGGGHHRSGVLKFAGPVPPGARSLQVIIRGIGGVEERVFEWKLPLESR